ncbi:nitrate reductase molybdenum cofactor assembly chaperone [Ectothiorhodospira shaposhnikovii]|uniref:nitrate reductase molybdenum cofactor assembly chaperone n=1 Tax=Ectothiorhodospira shaposhnikovii TaxID=1054 RepID=UPI0039A0C40E
MQKTLKLISCLLCYPDEALQQAMGTLTSIIDQEGAIPPARREALRTFMDDYLHTDLYALQERYVALFDRGRALSLHLFEHVHGESRDRGQAMVDLMDLYERHGMKLDARELPDYLPLFLEFLSVLPPDQARSLLGDALPVITLVGARLEKRNSPYHVLFQALETLTEAREDLRDIRNQAATEGPDESLVNMDRAWEEEAVRFMGAAPCGNQDTRHEHPLVQRPYPGHRVTALSIDSGGRQ